jgi:hypothetical protein
LKNQRELEKEIFEIRKIRRQMIKDDEIFKAKCDVIAKVFQKLKSAKASSSQKA